MATAAEIQAAYGGIGRSTIDQGGYDYWSKSGLTGDAFKNAFAGAAGSAPAQQNAAGWDAGYAAQNPTVTANTASWTQNDTNAFANPTGTQAQLAAARAGMSNRDLMEGLNIQNGGTQRLFNPNGTNTLIPGTDVFYTTPQTGNTLQRSQTAFRAGIDPNAVYVAAGLAPATGSYSGTNGAWVPSGAAAMDTQEARTARINALKAAGMSEAEAIAESTNGFQSGAMNVTGAPPPGLLGSGGAGTNGTGGAGGIREVSPYTQDVDPNSLVQNRMAGLLDANGAYMQAARLRATQDGQAHGLLNSSLSATAGERAAIESALPIAQSDAARYGQQQVLNQGDINQGNQFNATAVNHATLTREGVAADMARAQLGADTSLQQARIGADTSMANARLSADSQRLISENSTRQGIATALQSAVSNIQADYNATYRSIISNTTMDPASKAAALDRLVYDTNNSISRQGSIAGVNLDALLVGL